MITQGARIAGLSSSLLCGAQPDVAAVQCQSCCAPSVAGSLSRHGPRPTSLLVVEILFYIGIDTCLAQLKASVQGTLPAAAGMLLQSLSQLVPSSGMRLVHPALLPQIIAWPLKFQGGFELSVSLPIVYFGIQGKMQFVAGTNHLYVSRLACPVVYWGLTGSNIDIANII